MCFAVRVSASVDGLKDMQTYHHNFEHSLCSELCCHSTRSRFSALLLFSLFFGANSYFVFIFGYFFSCRSLSLSLFLLGWEKERESVYVRFCVCLYACKSSWWLRLRWFWCWFSLFSGLYMLYGFCLANCIVKNLCVCVCGMQWKRDRIEMCVCMDII